jgi:hypothetical protein
MASHLGRERPDHEDSTSYMVIHMGAITFRRLKKEVLGLHFEVQLTIQAPLPIASMRFLDMPTWELETLRHTD